MLGNQISTLATIIKDRDIKTYAGDAFWGLVKAFATGDVDAFLEAGEDVKNLIFHTPTLIFWDKMRRFLYGTFKNYEEQVKLASKFNKDNEKYEEFIKKQLYLINDIDDEMKIDFFAMLTRSFLLTGLDENLFFKLAKYIRNCTFAELDFLKTVPYSYCTDNNAMISSLYQYGLFSQKATDNGDIKYILSDFAKALKYNSLNFDDGLNGQTRISSYQQLSPLNIVEPVTWKGMQAAIGDETFILNGGDSNDI